MVSTSPSPQIFPQARRPDRSPATHRDSYSRNTFSILRVASFAFSVDVASSVAAALDDPTIAELCNLVRRQAEQLAIDFSVVLSEARCGIGVALVGAPELDREARADHICGELLCRMAER